MKTFLRIGSIVSLGLALTGMIAAQAQNACTKGAALEYAIQNAKSELNERLKTMDDGNEAQAPLRALAIHYWKERGVYGAKDSLVSGTLGNCYGTSCGNPPREKGSVFQRFKSANYHQGLYEDGVESEPPAPPPAEPPPEMMAWADQTLGCDWSVEVESPASQYFKMKDLRDVKACPQGEALVQEMKKRRESLNAQKFGAERDEWNLAMMQALSVLAWQDRGRAGGSDALASWALTRCPEQGCGDPAGRGTETFEDQFGYSDELISFRKSMKGELSFPATPNPPKEMLAWAERVLGCDASKPNRELPKTGATNNQKILYWQANVEGNQSFYNAALFYGGEYLKLWWRDNQSLMAVEDHEKLCQNFGDMSPECGLPLQWVQDMKNAAWAARYKNTNTNGVYSDSGNNPYNAGYKGKVPQPTYNPPVSNQPRCYDQGDGTEKCFYD